MAQQVLFVCTGNYYRSRFAELLFNTRAAQARLAWTADSRGFILAPQNVGAISPLTLEALATCEVPVTGDVRLPRLLRQADLEAADLVVALKEAEHRPWFDQRFPHWADRVEYWHIHDLDGTPATEACAMIAREVDHLIARLAADRRGTAPESTRRNSAS
jgi:protein-tyrosine phosphatase